MIVEQPSRLWLILGCSVWLVGMVFQCGPVAGFVSIRPQTLQRKHSPSALSALDQQQSNSTTLSSTTSASKDLLGADFESEAYEVYSRSLSPRKERKEVLAELQAGNAPMTWSKKVYKFPGRIVKKVVTKRKQQQPGKLILLRCGESTFNANGTFAGWLDPDLTAVGVQQCRHAASVLKAEGFDPDVVYTSRLKRAIKSAWNVLEELEALYLPVYKTVRLNQRMYGALQGLSKEETAEQVGATAVRAWRNSLKARPPKLPVSDPSHPRYDRRYADLSLDQIPSTESLLDCQERARPLWEYKIKQDIEQGKTVLVVAHRDAIRGLVKSIDGVGDVEIEDVRVPKCIPFVYRFQEVKGGANDGDLVPVPPNQDSSLTQKHTSATLLETPASLKAAVTELAGQESVDLDLLDTSDHQKFEVPLRDVLSNLRSQSDVLKHHKQPSDITDDDDETIELSESVVEVKGEQRWTDDPAEFEEYEYDEFVDEGDDVPVNIVAMPAPAASNDALGQSMTSMFKDGEPFVVLVRHGRTPHNNLGLFTGWEDPPLAEGGVEDARNAGRLLKRCDCSCIRCFLYTLQSPGLTFVHIFFTGTILSLMWCIHHGSHAQSKPPTMHSMSWMQCGYPLSSLGA